MSQLMTANQKLEELSRKVQADLHMMRYPQDPWLPAYRHDSGRHVYDVVIIGAGQGGLAIAAGLLRDCIDNVLILDRQPAGLEGPWNTTARMHTLRTLKHLPGIDPNLPNLSPQAWYTARYGSEAWEKLGKIPKGDWLDYLQWARKTLNLPVRNQVDVKAVLPEDDIFRLDIDARDDQDGDFIYARRVVLATGVDGGGNWYMPEFISETLPKERYALASEQIDFSRLAGKRVAVLGAGASAFDNASTALEAGARAATVCIRRKEIQRINPQMWMAKAGFLRHYADLDDALKWRFMHHFFRHNIPAPQDAYNRLSRLPGASIRVNAAWKSVRLIDSGHGEEVEIQLACGETLRVDFLIVAVGFMNNLELRPEIAPLAKHIALWSDRYTPPTGEADPQISSHPYLGPNFEFTEKVVGEAPYLSKIYNFNYSALVSMGLSGSAISGFRYSVPRLVNGLTRSLFTEDADKIFRNYQSYADPEMTGEVPFSNPEAVDRQALAG